MHMIVAVLVAIVWAGLPISTIRKAMEIGGPPCRSLIRTVLRVGIGAKVAESILYNHPFTLRILDALLEAIQSLRATIQKRSPGVLVDWLNKARSFVDPIALKRWDASTARLARWEADTQETIFEFHFAPKANTIGLLARVLQEFDQRGIDKTTTIAQVNPDGGCTIIIGVRGLSTSSTEAEGVIRSWVC